MTDVTLRTSSALPGQRNRSIPPSIPIQSLQLLSNFAILPRGKVTQRWPASGRVPRPLSVLLRATLLLRAVIRHVGPARRRRCSRAGQLKDAKVVHRGRRFPFLREEHAESNEMSCKNPPTHSSQFGQLLVVEKQAPPPIMCAQFRPGLPGESSWPQLETTTRPRSSDTRSSQTYATTNAPAPLKLHHSYDIYRLPTQMFSASRLALSRASAMTGRNGFHTSARRLNDAPLAAKKPMGAFRGG